MALSDPVASDLISGLTPLFGLFLGKVYNSYLPCNLYGVSGVSGVGKGWSRGGQGVVKDPMDSTRGVDCGVACGVA